MLVSILIKDVLDFNPMNVKIKKLYLLIVTLTLSIYFGIYFFGIKNQVEIQLHGNSDVREKDAIFNYRRKYLPTQQVCNSVLCRSHLEHDSCYNHMLFPYLYDIVLAAVFSLLQSKRILGYLTIASSPLIGVHHVVPHFIFIL